MMVLVKALLAALILVVVLGAGAIIKNGVPLTEPPGLVHRLIVYLSRNSARTTPDHELPELRTRSYPMAVDRVLPAAEGAVEELGWRLENIDRDAARLDAVVTTPWLRFKDDVRIRLERAPAGGTRVQVASRSRVGRADFGANISHIIGYYEALGARLR